MRSTPVPPCPETDVVVVGESLIDIIETPGGAAEFPGGSGMNVAYGLGRLGVNTALLTALGPDEHGRRIHEHLAAAGVRIMPGAERLPRTSRATAVLDGAGAARYDFDLEWSLPRIDPTFLPKALHTGSLAAFLQPGAQRVLNLLELFYGQCLITYDPNIRPALLGSHGQALAWFEEFAAMSTVVKLSDEDAEWLYPGQSAPEVSSRILDLGAALAVVTVGEDGSHLRSAIAAVDIPAAPAAVVDTVGAGDAYMASLIAGLISDAPARFDSEDLARLGGTAARAAAITVGRSGANPPSSAELLAALTLTPTS
ncbi:fructokinase [Arthrobacter sp. ov407]|uniref:carbohydrate kinase family protein n=1 Tax=Arthrobacter sp. ov407 TaxID=1761748 RepID=UPI00087EC5D5|nr:carbohydrate kinase [Arthrobacter sp. ov407]SDL95154.1 fructokinase [Arthrobacter sp. ov407]